MRIRRRTLAERIVHALSFEIFAIGISAPLAAWITGHGLFDMGVLTAVIALIAVIWNMIYNWLFDKAQNRWQFRRNLKIRLTHTIGFEAGLIVIAIPFVAWWLGISIWQALLLDIGFVLFYLPYGFFFNLAYDKICDKLLARQ